MSGAGAAPVAGLAPLRLGWAVAVGALALDQLVKWVMVEIVMDPPRVLVAAPFLNIVLVFNRGVSFGLLKSAPEWMPWILTAVALAIAVGLGLWLRRVRSPFLAVALGLVIGGALGNVIDRVRFGAVVDFLDFHVAGYHWPAFNMADSAITVGVGLLLLDALKTPRPSS